MPTADGDSVGKQDRSLARVLVTAGDTLQDQKQTMLRTLLVGVLDRLVRPCEPTATLCDLARVEMAVGQPPGTARRPGRRPVLEPNG